MKKILIPTDFSPNADNAVQFALRITERTAIPAHLIHTFQVNQSALVFKDLGRIMARDAEEEMQQALDRFRAQLSQGNLLTGEVIRGSLLSTLADFDQDHLIVMGTRGATDALEVFIGSTTGAVLKQANQPVLAIPAGFQYRPFHKIVLALDSQALPGPRLFQPLRELAHAFGATIEVFHQHTKESQGIDPSISDHLGEGLTISYHQSVNGDHQVNEHINAFVAEEKADLLCMIRRPRGFLQGLFEGSATTRQVYESPVPLLVLMDPKA